MTRKRNDSEEDLMRDNAFDFDLPSEEIKQASFAPEFEIDESVLAEAAWDAY